MSRSAARVLVALVVVAMAAATGVYFGYGRTGGQTPEGEQQTEVQQEKPGDNGPPEPMHDPGIGLPPGETVAPETPRFCAECFTQFRQTPPTVCTEMPKVAELPDYSALTPVSTEGWLEYHSPNYPFTFLYPPDWKFSVYYNNEYGAPQSYGIERVTGPVSEAIKLVNGIAASQPQDEGDFPTGSGMMDIWYGPTAAMGFEL